MVLFGRTQYDALLDNPDYAADFAAVQGATPAQFRDLFGINIYTGAVGPIDIQPVVQVNNDRVNNRTDLEQIRVVGGVRGDMPFMNFASVNDWSFDAYISSTESDGDSRMRTLITEERPFLSAQAWFGTALLALYRATGEEHGEMVFGDETPRGSRLLWKEIPVHTYLARQ